MISSIEESLLDADLFLLLIEPDVLAPDNIIVEKVLAGSTPVIIAINKIDEHKQEKIEEVCNHWKRNYPQREVIPISALHRFNTDKLLEIIKSYIPEHPFYYDPEDLSDRNLRFFAAEKIREKIFLNYHKEIPYSCDVYVESYEETDKLHRISAVILVERDSQKGILIGEKGSSLKKVGTQARLDLEEFLGTKVYLELKVKVCKNWRNDINQLKKLGYIR